MSQIQGSINKILESSGDILLKVWSDNGDMVPNASVDTRELNQHVQAYQKQLDELELEIKQWLELAKIKKPTAPKTQPEAGTEQPSQHSKDPEPQEDPTRPLDDDLGLGDLLGDSQMDFMF